MNMHKAPEIAKQVSIKCMKRDHDLTNILMPYASGCHLSLDTAAIKGKYRLYTWNGTTVVVNKLSAYLYRI